MSSLLPSDPDVVISFHDVDPRRSRRLPRDQVFILGCFLTVPGPGKGPRRPKTSKNSSLQFLRRLDLRVCGTMRRTTTATCERASALPAAPSRSPCAGSRLALPRPVEAAPKNGVGGPIF